MCYAKLNVFELNRQGHIFIAIKLYIHIPKISTLLYIKKSNYCMYSLDAIESI